MASSRSSRRRRERQRRQRLILTVIVVMIIVIAAGATCAVKILKKYSPSKERANLTEYYNLTAADDAFVVFDNANVENGKVINGEAYVSFDLVHESLNSRFYWDETEEILRYVTPDGVISVTPDSAEYTLGKDPYSADYVIATEQDGELYLAMDFVAQYSDIRYTQYDSPNRIVISDCYDSVTYNTVEKSTDVRELGGVKSPILSSPEKGDLVTVLEEGDTWTKVCTVDGFIGYMRSNLIGDKQEVVYDRAYREDVYPHITKDFDICLAWHQVTNQSGNSQVKSVLSSTEGVNVISPTWFYLNDNEGGIASLASLDYVTYCHNQGVEVWGLVSNLEDADVDVHSVLCQTSKRDNLVNNLISEAVIYGMDGINVDFESLTTEDSAGYLEFIRELAVQCENNSIVLSVDNYVPSAYTELYHRDEQAVFADYVVLMAYDEHFNGSDAGSVASISFVEQGVSDTLEEVPKEQLILGIPFYNRLWDVAADGTTTSQVLDMSDAEAVIANHGATMQWLDDCGQYYAEYETDEGSTRMIWLENVDSIQAKLDVMESNDLAGAAFWKLGYEKSSIWDTISTYFN